ncbi:MAG: hypothetical protein CMI90_05515 [Pelagibacteraceae bacterium]|nr:hypothetical protein [Pelagibacteraceae bacterium]
MSFSYDIPEQEDWIIANRLELDLKWNEKQITDHCKNTDSLNIFCKKNNFIIGALLTHRIFSNSSEQEIEIFHLGVLKNFRQRGVGFKIMKRLEKILILNRKITSIFLEVSSENQIAIKLYEKLRYKTYHERKNYYTKSHNSFSTKVNAMLLKKNLNE